MEKSCLFTGFLKKDVLYDSLFNDLLNIFNNRLNRVNTVRLDGFKWQSVWKFLKDGKRIVSRRYFRVTRHRVK